MSDWQNPLPLRILAVSDLGAPEGTPPTPIGVATYDEVLARFAPSLEIEVPDRLGGGGKLAVALDFGTTSSFHPDAVVAAVEPLAKAAEIRAALAPLAKGEGDPAGAAAIAAGAEGDAVKAALVPLAGDAPPDAEAIGKAVAALDKVLGAQVDEILHHGEFQRLESSWRGLRLLVEDAKAPAVTVEVLSVPLAKLVDTFREQVFTPEYEGADPPLAAVLLDFEFDHRAHLMGPLEQLAEFARVLQVGLVAATGPGLFGLKTLVHLTALSDLGTRLAAPVYQRLRKFQTGEEARWTALTLNRVLLRNLYEPGVGGVTKLAYSESADGAHPERYLWGRAVWLVGVNLARSFVANGHCAEISGHSGLPFHQGLPVRKVSLAEGQTGWSSVEVPLSEQQAQDLTRLGLTALVGQATGNFAYFPLVANLFRPQPGRLTVDSAISHQLFAGHVSHYALKLLGELPEGGDDAAAAEHFRTGFLSLLGPAGTEESVEVDVGARDGGARTARIRIAPSLTIQAKEIDLTFELPLA